MVSDARVRIQVVVSSFTDLTEPIITSHRGALRNVLGHFEGRGARILPSSFCAPINFVRALSLPPGGLRLFGYHIVSIQASALKIFGSR